MRTLSFALAASSLALAASADASGWDDASTTGEAALVAVALGLPAAKGDGKGVVQAGGSLGAAFLVTEGLKRTVHERRPTTATAAASRPAIPGPPRPCTAGSRSSLAGGCGTGCRRCC